MNKLSITGLAVAFAAMLLAAGFVGCTVTPDSYPVAQVNGETVTLQEVESFPGFKSLVDQLIQRKLIMQKAASQSIQVDPARVEEELEKMKQQIGPGPSFQQWLVENNVTEEQVRQQVRISLSFEELLKSEAVVTDKEVKANFEQNPNFFRQLYGRENDLTTEEYEVLTFEELREWLIDYFKRSRGYSQAQDIMDNLMAEANIDYLFMSPEARSALKKQQEEQRKEKIAAAQPPITIQEDGSGEQPSEAAGEAEEPVEEAAPEAEEAESTATEEEAPATEEAAPAEGESTDAAGEETANGEEESPTE